MAQTATMGPPLSPRETRRSGRRSIPSASTSASKSPDSDPAPKQKEVTQRPVLTTNNSGGRQKRLKQEDLEEAVEERKNGSAPSTSSASSTHGANGRTKRKTKEKDKQLAIDTDVGDTMGVSADQASVPAPEEEEQGITRCVCGSTGEDDPDAGEFMVQCETCKVWQHGLCMGYESEDQLHDDDYYCEQCRPELHSDLLKKLSNKRPRHSSATSHHNPPSAHSRVSRSHSPSTLSKQPSKRRNTMNSRDAAFDESLKEIIEATAAEAAAVHETASVTSTGTRDINGQHETDQDIEAVPSHRKKRKRNEDEGVVKKRTRSASSASDHHGSTLAREDTPGQSKGPPQAPAPAPKQSVRTNKRGGRKAAPLVPPLPLEPVMIMDGDECPPQLSGKRQAQSSRAKGTNAPKRPPTSHSASHGPGSATHEHGTRRNQTNGMTGQSTGSTVVESSRAYRNSHAYVVSQQPLFTSWNLPDYLAHLEEMLPTDTPRPLEVRAGPGVGAGTGVSSGVGRGESLDRTMERGVKVKWPSKRMSVGDMNKRVRALVEWVGREQATALDRARRREALERVLKEESKTVERSSEEIDPNNREVAMILDGDIASGSPLQDKILGQPLDDGTILKTPSLAPIYDIEDSESSVTMKMMEELMEELISFQERFGPGAKSRDRERRLISS